MIIDELITLLGFEVDNPEALDKYEASLETAIDVTRSLVRQTSIAIGVVGAFVTAVASGGDQLNKFLQTTGLAAATVQELEFAADQSGSSADSLRASLLSLGQVASQAARGVGGGVEVFSLLGVNITDAAGQVRAADDILGDISDRFQGLNQAQQIDFARQLGLTDDLIPLLQAGSAGIDELRFRAQELGLVVDQNILDTFSKFIDSTGEVRFLVTSLSRTIAAGAIPVILTLVDGFTDWVAANRELISLNVGAFIRGIVFVIQSGTRIVRSMVSVFESFVESTGGFQSALLLATTLLSRFLAVLLAGPAGLVLLIGTIGLLVEDMVAFFETGNSAGAQFADLISARFPEAEIILASLGGAFVGLGELVKLASQTIMDTLVPIGAFLSGDFTTAFDLLVAAGERAINRMVELFRGFLDNPVVGALSDLFDRLFSGDANLNASQVITSVAGQASNIAGPLAPAAAAARMSTDNSRTTGNTTISIDAPVTVTATGPAAGQGLGRDIARGLRNEAERVRSSTQSGVER